MSYSKADRNVGYGIQSGKFRFKMAMSDSSAGWIYKTDIKWFN